MIEDPSAGNSASAQMPVQMTTVQDCHMEITEVELEFHPPIMRYINSAEYMHIIVRSWTSGHVGDLW